MGSARSHRNSSDRPAPRVSAVLGLQKVELFRGLDPASLREIGQHCKWTRCKKNEYVIRRGDGTDRDVYFVISGLVRVAAPAGRGRNIIFRDVAAGDFFGEHSALDGLNRFADVVAVRESLLASMPPEAFRAILANHASVRERLLRRLSGTIRELAGRVLDLGARRVQSRVWAELVRIARASGITDKSARIERSPTHKEIASRVGTSREEVTRELSRLARQGLLERQGRALVLHDVRALEELMTDALPQDASPALPEEEWRHVNPPRAQRLPRAVLVADVLDAADLMERDEERTLERWRTFFARATAELIPIHAGRSLSHAVGDGFLAEFPDAVHAVRCAFELHENLARSNATAGAPPLGLRIGIHVAEVIVETFNVRGDGVHVAARLAELANAGETVVSAPARDQLTSGVEASVEDLGEQRLRNRSRAIRAFRLWPPARPAAERPSTLLRSQGRPSVAVIPFQLRTDDARFAFIGDGLADETIAMLSRIADFFVVSRLSSMAFRRTPLGLRSIGEMLGVQYVLSGSVQAAHPHALLMAELADTRDGRIVWTERFEGNLADVFALQAGLARKIAQSMAPVVRSVELRRARITNFEELDAYGMTLRGVELMHRLARDDFMRARQAFLTAIERNPLSPAPHAWLAKWHILRVLAGMSDAPAQDFADATSAAAGALACDADDALALAVDAFVAAWSLHDLDTAEQRLAQAVAANPNEPLAWLHSAITHAWRGRGAEAVQCADQALSLSPLDPMMYYFNSLAGMANLVAENYERAIDLSMRSLRENRLHTPTLRTLAAAFVLCGRAEEGREMMRRLRELEPALTAGALQARYPGRDSPQAGRFIGALVEAGLPR
ncbi:MAG TPA: cyclic nucleotide-binding domain-containing protein [Burkholderiales bacterium]|nr:cyclic nucleotide-binding domain-containing protein [Burkholderiales bacterium]